MVERRQELNDPLNHAVYVLTDLAIPKSQRSIVLADEKRIAARVVVAMSLLRVLRSVDLDHETRTMLDEIQDVSIERCLSAKVIALRIQFPQLPP